MKIENFQEEYGKLHEQFNKKVKKLFKPFHRKMVTLRFKDENESTQEFDGLLWLYPDEVSLDNLKGKMWSAPFYKIISIKTIKE